MTERLDRIFAQTRTEKRTALVCYLTAGIPSLTASKDFLVALPDSGADIIEIGMPFSDPMADGPTIQLASAEAINNGATTEFALQCAAHVRNHHAATGIVLMGYFNPIYNFGCERFAKRCEEAGVDGVIVVDLPPEVDAELREPLAEAGVSLIRLVTPTTDAERLKTITRNASGFLYYVSITGITGAGAANTEQLSVRLTELRAQMASDSALPLAVGFGIRTPQDVQALAPHADAVVVGSELVGEVLKAGTNNPETTLRTIRAKVAALRDACAIP